MFLHNFWKCFVIAILAANQSFDVKNVHGNVVDKGRLRHGLDRNGVTTFTLGVDDAKLRENLVANDPSLTNSVDALDKEVAKVLGDKYNFNQVVEVVRRRIDGIGISSAMIKVGDHRLWVELPRITDHEIRNTVREAFQKTAFLEFRLVHPRNNELVSRLLSTGACPEGYTLDKNKSVFNKGTNYDEVSSKLGYQARFSSFQVPDPRYAFMLDLKGRPYFVSRKAEVDGSYLEAAYVDRDTITGKLSIHFELKKEGAVKFAALTRNYKPNGVRNPNNPVGRMLAIVLDGSLYSAPIIASEVPNGEGEITGNFSPEEAKLLSNMLNAGALPLPLKIEAESE